MASGTPNPLVRTVQRASATSLAARARRVRRSAAAFAVGPAAKRELERSKGWQRERFEALTGDFGPIYESVRETSLPDTVEPMWRGVVEALEREFTPAPAFRFLRSPLVQETMFRATRGPAARRELAALRRHIGEAELAQDLEEELVGEPVLAIARPRTSSMTVQHRYHLLRHELAVPGALDAAERVLEWGGGYGNMARLVRRRRPEVTYVVVDLPLFTAVQWLYLATVHGRSSVKVLTRGDAAVAPGQVNLVPVGLAPSIEFDADLLISTWALSESAPAALEVVEERGWYGARHFLLAFTESDPRFPAGAGIAAAATERGASIEPVGSVPASRYALA